MSPGAGLIKYDDVRRAREAAAAGDLVELQRAMSAIAATAPDRAPLKPRRDARLVHTANRGVADRRRGRAEEGMGPRQVRVRVHRTSGRRCKEEPSDHPFDRRGEAARFSAQAHTRRGPWAQPDKSGPGEASARVGRETRNQWVTTKQLGSASGLGDCFGRYGCLAGRCPLIKPTRRAPGALTTTGRALMLTAQKLAIACELTDEVFAEGGPSSGF
jgi:hypothetical protein